MGNISIATMASTINNRTKQLAKRAHLESSPEENTSESTNKQFQGTEAWPRFLVIESIENSNKLSSLSPFCNRECNARVSQELSSLLNSCVQGCSWWRLLPTASQVPPDSNTVCLHTRTSHRTQVFKLLQRSHS